MKTMSVSDIKRKKLTLTNKDGLPKIGSKVREIYDLFASNKGQIITYSFSSDGIVIIENLRNFYGCDIRKLKTRKWILAGEYINGKYVSYFNV